MKCNNCFTNNPDYAKYCKTCGSFIDSNNAEQKSDSKNKYDTYTDYTNEETINDCYSVLGCTRTDDFNTIKSKYKKLVMKYHPDKCPDSSETTKRYFGNKFIEIQKAYEQIKAIKGVM